MAETRKSAQEGEICEEPDNIVDLSEKIVSLLDSQAARIRMRKFGRERVKSVFAWQHQRETLLKANESFFE